MLMDKTFKKSHFPSYTFFKIHFVFRVSGLTSLKTRLTKVITSWLGIECFLKTSNFEQKLRDAFNIQWNMLCDIFVYVTLAREIFKIVLVVYCIELSNFLTNFIYLPLLRVFIIFPIPILPSCVLKFVSLRFIK